MFFGIQCATSPSWKCMMKHLEKSRNKDTCKNYNEAPSHTMQNGHHEKLQLTNAREGVENREPSYTAGGNVSWCSHYERVWNFLRKLKIEPSYDPTIPLLGIYADKTLIKKRYMYPYVHRGIIHNS